LVVGLADGLDMYYGVRSAWWDEARAQQPQGFCRVAAMASPRHRKWASFDIVNELCRIGFSRPQASAVEAERVGLADAAPHRTTEARASVLGDLARIVAEHSRLRRSVS
jgi:hypothetical protein